MTSWCSWSTFTRLRSLVFSSSLVRDQPCATAYVAYHARSAGSASLVSSVTIGTTAIGQQAAAQIGYRGSALQPFIK